MKLLFFREQKPTAEDLRCFAGVNFACTQREVPTAAFLPRLLKRLRLRQVRIVLSLLASALWLFLPSRGAAAPGAWTQGSDAPLPASAPAGCVVDGIFYEIGGHYPYYNALRQTLAYDPQTDSWTRKKDMPTTRRFAAATAVEGIIYVVGGTSGSWPGTYESAIAAYDPKTDTWTTKTNIPTSRAALAACAVDGIIYAIGGALTGEVETSVVEVYDPKMDTWTTKTALPRPLSCAAASVADGRIYVFQGTDTFVYDPQTDHWETKAQFSPWTQLLMSATVNGTIYLFGGGNYELTSFFDSVWAYEPEQDQFTAVRKMPRTRAAAACGVVNGKVYLAGGANKEPLIYPDTIYYRTLDVFDPAAGTPRILSLSFENTSRVKLVWQGEAGLNYGVQCRADLSTTGWTSVSLPTGLTVTATNTLVETSCSVEPGESSRFFRVVEEH